MTLSSKLYKQYPKLQVGDKLYAVITYKTPNLFMSHHMPRPYFVLEVSVAEKYDQPEIGGPAYDFDTYFHLACCNVCLTEDDAKQALVDIFAQETGGAIAIENVEVVSKQAYEKADKSSNSSQSGYIRLAKPAS